MTDHNGGFVGWGRYDAEHQEIMRRLTALENRHESRTNRIWAIGTIVLAGFILPIVTSTLVTLLHLHGS